MNHEVRPEQVAQLVGRRLRQRREQRGLSLAELSELTVYSPVAIGSWERGDRQVKLAAIWELARALDCSPAMLLPINKASLEENLLLQLEVGVATITDALQRLQLTS